MECKTPLESCKVYTIAGVDMIHISEFARITHRSPQSTRHLIEDGNVVRKMKFFRDRSRLMIPVAEIFGYPLVQAGHSDSIRAIYHYKLVDGDFQRVLCKSCSYENNVCEERRIADELIVPEGDK